MTPEKTAKYENLVALSAQQAMAGRKLLDGPLLALIDATFSFPASWSEKKKRATKWKVSRPDLDNCIKVCDGLNGIVFNDDSAIVQIYATKKYGEVPGLRIELREIG